MCRTAGGTAIRAQARAVGIRLDIQRGIGRHLAAEADDAATQLELAAGEFVVTADQRRLAGDRRIARLARDRQIGGPFARQAQAADDHLVGRLRLDRQRPGRWRRLVLLAAVGQVDLADVEPRYGGGGTRLAQAVAAAIEQDVTRDLTADALGQEGQRPGDGRTEIVAVDHHRTIRLQAHVDPHAARRAEIERADTRHAPALARIGGEAVDLQLRSPELAAGDDVGQHGAGRGAFDPRAIGLQHAPDHRRADPPADVRADRDGAGQVEQLDAGQPPQGIRRPLIAQLRDQRRGGDTAGKVARPQRLEQRLRPPDRPPARRHHRAHAQPVGGQHARQPHVDRSRGEDEARTAQPAQRQVDPSRRCLARPAGIDDPPRRGAAQPQPRETDVEDRERHARQAGIHRQRVVGEPPRQAALATREGELGRRQLPPVAIARDDRGFEQFQRPAIERTLRRHGIPIRRHRDHGLYVERAPPRSGDRRTNFARAATQLGVPRKAREAQPPLSQPLPRCGRVDRRARRIEQQRRLQMPTPQRRTRQLRISRIQAHHDLLHRAHRVEAQRTRQAAARHRQRALEPARRHREPTRCNRAAHRQPVDEQHVVDARRQQQDAPRPRERPQPRSALRLDVEAGRRRVEVQSHLAQPHRRIGRGEDDIERRPIDLPVQPQHRHRAVARMPPGRVDMERLVVAAITAAPQRQQRRRQHQIGKADRPVGRALQRRDDARQTAGQRAQEAVVEPHDLRDPTPDDARALAARLRHDAQIGSDVHDAQPLDVQPPERPVQPRLVSPGRQIQRHHDPPVELVRSQPQRIRGQQRSRQPHRPVEAEIAQDAARDVAHTRHLRRDEARRHRQHTAAQSSAARQPHPAHAGPVDRQLVGAQAIVELRGAEPAIQHRAQHDAAAAHRRDHCGGAQKPRLDPHVAPGRCAEIDHPGRRHRQRRAAQRQRAVEPPVGEGRRACDPHAWAGQPLDDRAGPSRRRHLAPQRIAAGIRRQREVDRPCRTDTSDGAPTPMRPAALAVDVQPHRPPHAEAAREHTGRSAGCAHVDIEPVTIRRGIDPHRQPIGPRDHRAEPHEGTSVTNIRPPRDPPDPRRAEHRLREHQSIDTQIVDRDIKIGQDRSALRVCPRMRRVEQHRLPHRQPPDHQPMPHPRPGPPIEIDRWRLQQQSIEIVDSHIGQPRPAIQRPVDPPDREAQPVRGAHRRNPLRDPAMADAGVDQRQRGDEHRHQRGDAQPQPAQGAPQNACPSDT
ncbi:hypothetical protein WR25_10346 [Diploscapter pachys]|uniref:Uncharacterized protein n=1 Tax=Diploscapter pachys TaxID=2018661 RepID=A0A2A2K0N6_9BILA|nr:hypothetical protein WR25_10346 [Diploscapter pachys]